MKKTNLFKMAALTAVFALGSMFASAQITVPSNDTLQRNTDETKVVKVIDNKGTVKYIQSMNGITQITSTDAGFQTTTTLQLGGQLTTDTYIDVNGSEFGIKGLTTAANGTGLQLVVIDANGNLRKLDFDDLIQSGRVRYDVTADLSTGTLNIPVLGVPTGALAYEKVYVYRNGAKLLANSDYTIGTDQITIVINPELENLYDDDIIEIHYIK